MLGGLNGTTYRDSLNPLNTCGGDCRTRQCVPGDAETTGSTRGKLTSSWDNSGRLHKGVAFQLFF